MTCILEPYAESTLHLTDGLSLSDDGIVDGAIRMEGDAGDGAGSYLSLPFNGQCTLDPAMCESGLAIGLFVKVTDDDLQQTGPKYILSSGYGNATGFDIYRESNTLVFQVRDGTHLWTSIVNDTLDSSGYFHAAFVWSEEEGLTALIDGEEVHQMMTKVPYFVLPNLGNITLGARIVDGEFTDFASGTYDEMQIMQLFLPDDEHRKLAIMNGIDGDDCRYVTCDNGICRDAGIRNFTCVCDIGYIGTLCSEDEDDCVNSLCLNGATCHDRIGTYRCECEFGYDGDFCEIDLTPTFNYSYVAIVSPEDLLDQNDELLRNPLYELAQRFESLADDGNQFTEFDAVGRGEVGMHGRMTAAGSWMNAVPGGGEMSLVGGDCLSRPDLCQNGFAASFWMKIFSSIDLDTPGIILHGGANKGYGAFTMLELTDNYALILTVGYAGGGTVSGTSRSNAVEAGHWINVGLTYSTHYGVAIFINGHQLSLQSRQSGSPDTSNSDRITFGTVYTENTAFPIAVSDFVVWNRYLFPFEQHRFLGVTATEGSYLRKAAYYWTSDGYIARDFASLSEYATNLANTSEITLPGGEEILTSRGRDGKGEASHVNGTDNLWFLLGDLPGTCISDPFLCQDGVTLALWARIYPVHDDVPHFIMSTGEQSTRGMSFYMRRGVLGANLIDGDRKWITEIEFTPDPDDWIHLAISWRKNTGMILYKDGYIVSYDDVGIRKIREADLDTKIILGRRNDFLDAYSSMEFEELVFWERFVETWDAREVFGLSEFEQYDDALYQWKSEELITSKLDILMTKSLGQEEYIGPTASVRVTEDPMAVDLTQSASALNLGSFQSDCFTTPMDCSEGLSISMWVKLLHGSSNDPVGYLLSAGRGDGSGVAIYKEGHDLIFVIENATNVWATTINVQVIPNNEFSNIALTWSASAGITIYIDGKAPVKANVTSVHAPVGSAANDHMTIGRPNDANSDYGSFIILNLVVWDKYFFPRKSHKLTTLTDEQIDCIHSNKICWPFESLLSLKYPYTLSSSGAKYKFDRRYNGRSVYTNGRTGAISLGNFRNACPKRLTACENGFVLSIWLRLEDNDRNVGTLVSLGAEVEDEQGISLVKDEFGLLATVADGSHLWVSRIYNGNFTYGPWMFLGWTWSPNAGIDLFIDGIDLTHTIDNKTEEVRSGRTYNELFLGRGSLLEGKYIEAYFDDVELEFPVLSEDLPDAEDLTGIDAVTAYASADEYYNLVTSDEVELVDSSVVSDRNDDRSSAVNTGITNTSHSLGFIDIGDYSRTCVSDPSRCTPSGVTLSIWVKINSLEHLLNNITNPTSVGYILSSGAQAPNGRGFAVAYDGVNLTVTMQHSRHMIEFSTGFEDPEGWFNLAVSYSEAQGLRLYIDGVLTGSSTEEIETPIVSDFATHLHLGKRNDMNGDYLGASFDDFATFYKTFEEDDPSLADTLTGNEAETGVVVTTNHPELDALAPFSGKPDCKVLHDADCARSIYELNDVLSDEAIINGTVYTSVRNRLRYLVDPRNDVPQNDLAYCVDVFEAIVYAPVDYKLNETEAMSELSDLIQITSNMMQPNRSENWKKVNEVSMGTPSLVKTLEDYGIQVSRRLRTKSGHEKLVLSAENIGMQVDSLENSNQHDKYSLPDYSLSNWNETKLHWNDPIEKFTLPKHFFQFTEPGKTSSLVATMYNTLPDMIPEVGTQDVKGLDGKPVKINSRVASLSVDPPLRMDLYNPIRIVFAHIAPVNKSSHEEVACSFWNHSAPNTTNGAWDTRGCEVVSTNETITICHVYHMTSFAIIIKPIFEEEEESDEGNLQWMARILSVFSISFLGVYLFYLVCAKRLRVILHTIHINLCVAVIFALLSLAGSGDIKDAWGDCMLSGCLIHYFNTVIMLWLFIEAFQLFTDLTESLEIQDEDDDEDEPPFQERVKYYILFGWGVPFLNVGVAFGFSPDAYIEQEAGFCWLDNSNFLWCAFVGPLGFFGLCTLYMLYRMLRDIDEQVYREDRTTIFKSSYFGTWTLQIYFLITWGVGLVGIYGLYLYALYLFVLAMSCLGIVTFIVHALLNTEVRLLLGLRNPDKTLTPIEKIHLPPEFDDVRYIKPTYIP
ncbi:uncharacterized protein [Antedon mediterranea]|uniref:uncharacterized protein n=1 Tax=Antedon mediterranea TaxID=105859 RepID=UPI003AF7A8A4